METNRERFFKMVDSIQVDPLVAWARDEIVRLENELKECSAGKKNVVPKKVEASGAPLPKTQG